MNNTNEQLLQDYEEYLLKGEMSTNTVKAYVWTASYFLNNYSKISKNNILAYKKYLMDNYKPQTVNCRIYALNSFLRYLNKKICLLKQLKSNIVLFWIMLLVMLNISVSS